jgi:hypothetical protein
LNRCEEYGIKPAGEFRNSFSLSHGSPARTDECTRRSFLEASTALFALGFGLATLFGGCARTKEEAEADALSEAFRALYGDPSDTMRIARSAGWDRKTARERLGIDMDALHDPVELRSNIEHRIRQDFLQGRTHAVDLWWLAETEVAVAVLIAGHSN